MASWVSKSKKPTFFFLWSPLPSTCTYHILSFLLPALLLAVHFAVRCLDAHLLSSNLFLQDPCLSELQMKGFICSVQKGEHWHKCLWKDSSEQMQGNCCKSAETKSKRSPSTLLFPATLYRCFSSSVVLCSHAPWAPGCICWRCALPSQTH